MRPSSELQGIQPKILSRTANIDVWESEKSLSVPTFLYLDAAHTPIRMAYNSPWFTVASCKMKKFCSIRISPIYTAYPGQTDVIPFSVRNDASVNILTERLLNTDDFNNTIPTHLSKCLLNILPKYYSMILPKFCIFSCIYNFSEYRYHIYLQYTFL